MDWDDLVIYEINDLYDYEPEMLEELDRIDRRSTVKNILSTRIKRHFRDIDEGNLLDNIANPDVLEEPAVYLNLMLVFLANSTGTDEYSEKARQYEELSDRSLQRAFELIEFEGLDKTGIVMVR